MIADAATPALAGAKSGAAAGSTAVGGAAVASGAVAAFAWGGVKGTINGLAAIPQIAPAWQAHLWAAGSDVWQPFEINGSLEKAGEISFGIAGMFTGGGVVAAKRPARLLSETGSAGRAAAVFETRARGLAAGKDAATLAVRGANFAPGSTAIRQTGARQVLDPVSMRSWDIVENSYDVIRADASDVAAIAKNTGWAESRVARVKDHVFFKEHELDSGLRRFDADPDMLNSWSRLTAGDFVQSDVNLLRHEIFESKYEGIFKTNYRQAHEAALRAGRDWAPE